MGGGGALSKRLKAPLADQSICFYSFTNVSFVSGDYLNGVDAGGKVLEVRNYMMTIRVTKDSIYNFITRYVYHAERYFQFWYYHIQSFKKRIGKQLYTRHFPPLFEKIVFSILTTKNIQNFQMEGFHVQDDRLFV